MKKMLIVVEGVLFWVAIAILIMEQGDASFGFFFATKLVAIAGFAILIRLDAYRARIENRQNHHRN